MNKSRLFMAAILLLQVEEDAPVDVFIQITHSFKTLAEKHSTLRLNGVRPLYWLKNPENIPNDDR